MQVELSSLSGISACGWPAPGSPHMEISQNKTKRTCRICESGTHRGGGIIPAPTRQEFQEPDLGKQALRCGFLSRKM